MSEGDRGLWASYPVGTSCQLARKSLVFRHAITQLEHAEWLTSQGRAGEAQPLLAQARDTFERLEAKPWLERLDAAAAAAMQPA